MPQNPEASSLEKHARILSVTSNAEDRETYMLENIPKQQWAQVVTLVGTIKQRALKRLANRANE